MFANKIIDSFAPGAWIESWPHKINLSDHLRIVDHLNALAATEVRPQWIDWLKSYMVTGDQKLAWRYNYIHALGNDAFLEIDLAAPEGWVLFQTNDELALFILSHS